MQILYSSISTNLSELVVTKSALVLEYFVPLPSLAMLIELNYIALIIHFFQNVRTMVAPHLLLLVFTPPHVFAHITLLKIV